MFDKYTRAEAALRGGADLVLELPLCAACGSAEYFSDGAVDLFMQTDIVTDLCFGSECGDLEPLAEAAALLAEEPEEYRSLLRQHLRTGVSFPLARATSLQEALPSVSSDMLSSPNNLLGIEYLKALKRRKSGIRPHTIAREGGLSLIHI